MFGAIALLLAATGIYGVMGYGVASRKREFGIRVALGTREANLLALVVRQGMTLAGLGFAFGLAGALGATRFMSSILYHVSPTDLPAFATSSLMLLVALAACYLPARRILKDDPASALRYRWECTDCSSSSDSSNRRGRQTETLRR